MKLLNSLLAILFIAIIAVSCTSDDENTLVDPSLAAYANADASNGGIMYDKFWASESDFNQSNPNIATLSAKSDFFRCKQCHGWDGLGNKGAYINRGPRTSRPNVSEIDLYSLSQSKTPKQLFDVLTKTSGRRNIATDLSTYDPSTNKTEGDKMPNLIELLTEDQIWDLVKFLKEGMLDVRQLYDATTTGTYPTGTWTVSNIGTNGNAANGKTYFATNCSGCHGATGTTLLLEGMTAGEFTRKKGNEAQHKIHYGQLGSSMTGKFNITPTQMKDLYKGLADVAAFPNAN